MRPITNTLIRLPLPIITPQIHRKHRLGRVIVAVVIGEEIDALGARVAPVYADVVGARGEFDAVPAGFVLAEAGRGGAGGGGEGGDFGVAAFPGSAGEEGEGVVGVLVSGGSGGGEGGGEGAQREGEEECGMHCF